MPAKVSASANVTLAWDATTSSVVAGYNIYYGGVSGSYTNRTSVGLATSATISNLANGGTYYFSATTYSASGAEGAFSSEVSYTVPAVSPNQPPTLNPIGNLTISENAGLQTVALSGISSGASNEVQTLTVSAVSANTQLIANPTVIYSSPNANGSLSFTPVANASGSAKITVTVNDGGASNNTVTQSFTVTVNPTVVVTPPNQPPTLNPLGNLTISENAGLQTVALSGISSGASNEVQTLTVSAVSANTQLIANPTVIYSSPNANGSLSFTPAANASGSAKITVTVNDGGASNNTVTQSFTVTVNPTVVVTPPNQPPTLNPIGNLTISENAGLQTVALSGISSGASNEVQTLTVSAVSANTQLIANPTVIYSSPNANGSLSFTPVANASGSAKITVTVNDGGASNNTVTQSFTVTVNPTVVVTPPNQPPTLNPIGNLTISENAGLQTVALSGISSGASNEVQTLTVSAVSANTQLIANPTVIYSSPNANGSLSFTPVANASGSAKITVTVNDGGASNNTVTQSFTVTVVPISAGGNAVNLSPTLDPINNMVIYSKNGAQTVNLTGISAGVANRNPSIKVTAVSSGDPIVGKLAVHYTNPNSTGTLTFAPANCTGVSTIVVSVNDGGTSNNIVSQSFTVTIVPLGASTNVVASPDLVANVSTIVKGAVVAAASPTNLAAMLLPTGLANGQFALTVSGAANSQYIVQASADLVNWVPVQTNTAPFTFVDTHAGQFNQRYYRALLVP